MPSEEDLRVTVDLGLRINEDGGLDLATEIDGVQEGIMAALHVSPEHLRQIREGSIGSVSMGCMVSAPAPCPECPPASESHPQRDRMAAILAPELAESLPAETRDRIIREYLENSRGLPRVAAAGAPYIDIVRRLSPSPWHPVNLSAGINHYRFLEASWVREGGHPFKIIQPLPPWCKEGAVVRRWEDGQDYTVIAIDNDHIRFRAVGDDPAPLVVICSRGMVSWSSEWRPHPLPPTRWERLMED